MSVKLERKRIAKTLYCKIGLSKREVASILGISASTIDRYVKEDLLSGVDWQKERAIQNISPISSKKRFQACLELILSQAQSALEGLEQSEELPPEKRAQSVAGIMDTIHKATNTAKKLDPELNLEVVIAEVMALTTDTLLERAPKLAKEWLEVTHVIEEKIQSKKTQWQ